jgi:hypothetical protein
MSSCVLSDMVAIGTGELGSLTPVEELSEEDPLSSPEIRLHIAIDPLANGARVDVVGG